MGNWRFLGGAALARETGFSVSYVNILLHKGVPADEIRARAKLRVQVEEANKRGAGRSQGAGGRLAATTTAVVGKMSKAEAGRLGGKTKAEKAEKVEKARTYVPLRPQSSTSAPKPALSPSFSFVRSPVPMPEFDSDDDTETEFETLASAQTRKEIALANQRELEVRKMLRELIPVAEANAHVARLIVAARDAWVRAGAELGDRLAVETDSVKCAQMVTDEAVRILKGITEMEVSVTKVGGK